MKKIVYNSCYGGFGLSAEALSRYIELTGRNDVKHRDIPRDDPVLVGIVESMGSDADGYGAQLEIAEVTSGTRYRIDEYDGNERVMTVDDYDWEIA